MSTEQIPVWLTDEEFLNALWRSDDPVLQRCHALYQEQIGRFETVSECVVNYLDMYQQDDEDDVDTLSRYIKEAGYQIKELNDELDELRKEVERLSARTVADMIMELEAERDSALRDKASALSRAQRAERAQEETEERLKTWNIMAR